MGVPRETLQRYAASFGVELDTQALSRLDCYADMLVEYNKRFNLTAITQPQEIAIKHFADSLSAFTVLNLPHSACCIDVGTGAGFPGMVLLIARPDLRMTFLDSTKKKLGFLSDVLEQTGLHADVVHCRAEEAGQNTQYREAFDCVTARAVASMDVLCEYCLPLARKGGAFLAMKGPGVQEELRLAQKAIAVLGGDKPALHELQLDGCGKRSLVFIQKVSQTPPKYPRPSAQIAKRKLGM